MEVTKSPIQSGRNKKASQRRCVWFIQPLKDNPSSSHVSFKAPCSAWFNAVRSFINQIICIAHTLSMCSHWAYTHAYTHRGLIAVNGGLCNTIQQSISYICPNIEPSRAGYFSPDHLLVCNITWQRPFGCHTGRASTSVLALKRPMPPFSQ